MAENGGEREKLNPCSQPICDFNGDGCLNGQCKSPNYCSCNIGWTGANCGECIPLPGCLHGYCQKGLECICETGWLGAHCDIRELNQIIINQLIISLNDINSINMTKFVSIDS